MKIGFFEKQNAYTLDMLHRLQAAHPKDQFLAWHPGEQAPATDLDILFAAGKVTAKDLEAQTKLGLLQIVSAGYDGVDVEAATSAGIWVASAPTTKTGNGESVAEFAILLMLAASRRLNEKLARTRGHAQTSEGPEFDRALFGKTACIVGLGGIGDLLIERLRGFSMTLTGVDKYPQNAPPGVKAYAQDDLKLAAADADYLVLAIPGSKDNEDMIDATVLAAMKQDAILINIGRGILIEEPALLAAVTSGHLYGAGLDVVKEEPVAKDNPLLTDPRIFVTPHIAGITDLTFEGTVRYLGEVLAHFQQGIRFAGIVNEPPNPRTPLRDSKKK